MSGAAPDVPAEPQDLPRLTFTPLFTRIGRWNGATA